MDSTKIKLTQQVKLGNGNIRTISKSFKCADMAHQYSIVWKRMIKVVVKDHYSNEEIDNGVVIDLTKIGKTLEEFKNTMPY